MGFAAALFAALMMKPALRTLLSLLLIFPTMHLAYGLGSAWGLLCRLIRPSRREGAGSRGVTGVKGVEIVKVLGQPQGGCPASRLAS